MRRFSFLIFVFLATLEAQTAQHTMRPVLRGRQYAVSSMAPQATQVAERILREGGNAFDAVVAGQAALGLADAAMNGIGSDAVILVYDSQTQKVISINAEGAAPKLATIDWYRKNQGGKIPVDDTLLSATVPGAVDAWYILLDRWGTMSFAQVLAPAIEMAENGFPIGNSLAYGIEVTKKLRKYPSSMKVYFPGGKAPQAGDVWKNPELAATLKKLVEAETQNAAKGRHEALKAARDRFYKGDIAHTMAEFSAQQGGLFRYEDFANYSAKIEEPVSVDYRGYQVFKNRSATQGPAELIALNLLEGYDLKSLGLNSAAYIHTSVEAVKLALADREKYLGDADFIQIPFAGLLSKDYAVERRKLIDPGKASLDLRPGVAEKFAPGIGPLNRPLDYTIAGNGDHQGDTSYITVVDRRRNVVSFEPSLHSAFGTGVVMADLGFPLNCRGDYFSLMPGTANALAPGKRPRSTLQSTLVLKAGQPVLVTGSPGGDDQCMRTLQTFLNIVEFGMNVQQAIEAPRWTTRSFPSSPFPHTMYPGDLGLEDRIPPEVRDALAKKGHKIQVAGPWTLGRNAAIQIDWQSGVLSAGADPRGECYDLAW